MIIPNGTHHPDLKPWNLRMNVQTNNKGTKVEPKNRRYQTHMKTRNSIKLRNSPNWLIKPMNLQSTARENLEWTKMKTQTVRWGNGAHSSQRKWLLRRMKTTQHQTKQRTINKDNKMDHGDGIEKRLCNGVELQQWKQINGWRAPMRDSETLYLITLLNNYNTTINKIRIKISTKNMD